MTIHLSIDVECQDLFDSYLENACAYFKRSHVDHAVIDRVEKDVENPLDFRGDVVIWAKMMRATRQTMVWTSHQNLAERILKAVGEAA